MREIIFRAKILNWKKPNKIKRWFTGYYATLKDTSYCFKEDHDKCPVTTHHLLLQEQSTDWGLPNELIPLEIDPKTLCQFTGYVDKNGVKIFEKDLVKVANGDIGHVYWDEEAAAYRVTFKKDKYIYAFGSRFQDEYEVVGNIIDNKIT